MLELLTLPDERLQTASVPVRNINGELDQYCEQMVEVIHKAGGIGLAGVQTGRMENFFVVYLPDDKPRVFINPEITDSSDRADFYEEGCLSIPGVYAELKRPTAIQIRAWDRKGNEFTLETQGLLSRVIQHEYDHLQGRLFYEYLKPGQQRRLIRAYNKLNENTLRRNS